MRGVLRPPHGEVFRRELKPLWEKVTRAGVVNSLGQVVLKVASPGVPDFYQGTELWDWNLVDPDNRRAVDFGKRRAALAEVKERADAAPGSSGEDVDRVASEWWNARLKLLVTTRALQARRQHAVFVEGDYEPVSVEGTRAENVIAFTRRAASGRLVAIASRWSTRLGGDPRRLPTGDCWGDSVLDLGRRIDETWRDALSGREIATAGGRAPLAHVLGSLPVALLLGTD